MTDERRRLQLSSPLLTAGLAGLLVVLVWAAAGGPAPLPSATASAVPTSAPPASAGPSGTPASSPSPSFVRPTPSPAPSFTSYVVRPGDSLSSIARRFDTTPRSVAWWNRESYPTLDPESEAYDPDHIEPGWVLVVLPGVIVDEGSQPSPSPALPTPTPGASAGPTPTAWPTGPASVVANGPRGSGVVALTFDMGGRLDPALDIVGWLVENRVHATLFPTGKAGTTTDVGRAVLELASAHPELFTFGNHSWSHPYFTTLTASEMAEQLVSSETAIESATGATTRPWFRPPYGAWNAAVRAGVGAAGWPHVVMWDVDTIDWKATADGGPTAADIVTKVVTNAQGGSIVLMHLGGWHTLEALPGILDGLAAKGLRPVTLQEMLLP